MTPSRKPEWPPLLEPGFHQKQLDDLKGLCVDPFPASKNREQLLSNLKDVIAKLETAGLAMEIWVDGSFLTRRLNPEDVDIVVSVDASAYNASRPEQRKIIDWVRGHECRYGYHCDGRTLMRYPEGHKLHRIYEIEKAQWLSRYGYSRQDVPKGIVLLHRPPQ